MRSWQDFSNIAATHIPWGIVKSWKCNACGECCKWFQIPVNTREYSRIGQAYGYHVFEPGLGVAYLRKQDKERCIFQVRNMNRWLCGLQAEKPHVCKMWPFTVSKTPLYGRKETALWQDQNKSLYLYIDPRCPNVILGKPTDHFIEKVIPEFVEIAFDRRKLQEHSTHALDRDNTLNGRTIHHLPV
jgi:Fe-S-cluster containining protein